MGSLIILDNITSETNNNITSEINDNKSTDLLLSIKTNYPEGNFYFIKYYDEQMIIKDVYDKITPEQWKLLKNYQIIEGNFIYPKEEPIIKLKNDIYNKITYKSYHDNRSLGLILKNMEYIAKNGWDKYVSTYLKMNSKKIL